MTAPLTDQQLAEIRDAIPLGYDAPWNFVPAEEGGNWLVGYNTDNPNAGLVATVPDYGFYLADFITRARTDVPVLLAEVTRLRAELEQARAERDRLLAFANWTARNTYPLTEVHTAALTAIDSPSTRAALVDLAQVAAETAAADDDEWVRCSLPHCPNAERYQYAQQRGWTPQHMGTWHCAEHSPACTCGARPVHQTGCDTDQDN